MIIKQYPKAKKSNHTDIYFNQKVSDPYVWLEDSQSDETNIWINEQNKLTNAYLSEIPYHKQIKEVLTKIANYPKQSIPWLKNNKYFIFKNNGLLNHDVLYIKDSLEKKARLLFDPNTMSDDQTVALSGFDISKDGKYIAYQTASGGADWSEIQVKTIDGKDLDDKVEWVKHSGFTWYQDGFFYSSYDKPTDDYLSVKNQYQKVYYHKLNTLQKDDILIYNDSSAPQQLYSTWVCDDEKYLVLNILESTSGNKVLIKNLEEKNSSFKTIVHNFDNDNQIVDKINDTFYMLTNINALNKKLVKFNYNDKKIIFEDVIAEKDDVLENVLFVKDKIVAQYLHKASSRLLVYSKDGRLEGEIELPSYGSVNALSGSKESNYLFYSFVSYSNPGVQFKVNIETLKQELYHQIELAFKPSNYITKQIFYPSKDKTMIPMFITYKEGLVKDGKNPLLLYGYGGFGANITPRFAVDRMLFLEHGGIYVEANLRGGGEFGDKWHKAGVNLNKQNVFDDFIYAAKYLIKEKYTNSDKLAIKGASNGGLLVGACINQRPDLFKVALPAVGVMDMLKFHKFTIGGAWIKDYGSSDNKEEFKNLLSYSPVHNVKDNVNYPATLITTADHDDRVVPAHSYKFAATLQNKRHGDNPILIRIESKAGHGAGKPLYKQIEELTDEWSFTFYNLNINYKNILE